MSDHVNHAKAIGIYEMIFGVIGALACLFQLISSLSEIQEEPALLALNLSFGFCLFALCAYAGYRLYQRSSAGFELSIWIQVAQIPKLVIAGFSYFFAAGPQLIFGFGEVTGLGFSFKISPTKFHFGVTFDEPLYDFAVNIFALSLCIYLFKLSKLRKFEEQVRQLKDCPFCGAVMNITSVKTLGVFCGNCQNVIRAIDLVEKRQS